VYGYSFPQILAGVGTFGVSLAMGFGVFLKIIMPLVGAKKSDVKYVSTSECQIRHDGNTRELEKMSAQLSKLFTKHDETQKSVARIEGILTPHKST
jgi:hypothetical protein